MSTQESDSSPLRCVWLGSNKDVFESTRPAWRPLFSCDWSRLFESTDFTCVRGEVPGKVVLLEFSNRMIEDHGVSLINFAERTIRFVFEVAKHPVIVCMGDSIAAQTVVHWLKLGVFTYLERNAGLDRVQQIFAEAGCRSTGIARSFVRYESLLNRWNSISDREANVLEFLLEGIPNKTIANRLGVSQRTIETRRHNLYEKLESRSVAEVVRIIYELGGLERTFRRQHEPATVGPRPHFHLSRALPPLNAVTYDIAIRD